ncbi:DUF4004 family protein [Alkalihalobacillus pseudalcaliphilus]|uniref:DUF4004 family protein n=1 Tax=Alkalihalobacillus pseudalcaliphilus TaxID=79884 RepID=UPI00064D9B23|nr:DUF4004 family protein [Alkalihalobacillus pseudalcaliphilus]KMK75605.1 hypothetical protein AB990_09975 [Alkalihalobacillus pseudalcaliphilus]
MEEELISKKDLLKEAGISYGQLYRWKRKNLIPESWFIRKSTFTGQETFFPKAKMMTRIKQIIDLKDGLSLDQLADQLSGNLNVNTTSLSKEYLMERNIVSSEVMELFPLNQSTTSEFQYSTILSLLIVEEGLKSGEISLEEAKQMITLLINNGKKGQDAEELHVFILRKMGVSFVMITENANMIVEANVKIVIHIEVKNVKQKLARLLV